MTWTESCRFCRSCRSFIDHYRIPSPATPDSNLCVLKVCLPALSQRSPCAAVRWMKATRLEEQLSMHMMSEALVLPPPKQRKTLFAYQYILYSYIHTLVCMCALCPCELCFFGCRIGTGVFFLEERKRPLTLHCHAHRHTPPIRRTVA